MSEVAHRARARLARRLRECRNDPSAFAEYILTDELTGRDIKNAPMHVDWHEQLSSGRRVVIWSPVEHGKTNQIAIARTLYAIGRDPSRRVLIVSDTGPQAKKNLKSCRQHIESNHRLRQVFPHLTPSTRPGDSWGNDSITVQRSTISKDPSIQACGTFGKINGSRVDVAILDDCISFENSRTLDQRNKLEEWIDSTVMMRITDTGYIWIVGTPWDVDDPAHRIAKRESFKSVRYSAVVNPDDDPSEWIPTWGDAWSLERILERKRDVLPHAFAKKLLCRIDNDASGRFQQSWMRAMLYAGRKNTMVAKAPVGFDGQRIRCFTGVDLGVSRKSSADLTVFFTIALLSDGRRLVLEIESGRYTSDVIIQKIQSIYERFGSTIAVEDNGAQDYLVQMSRTMNSHVPIVGLTTGTNKWSEDYGIESMALELYKGIWICPSTLEDEGARWEDVFHSCDAEAQQWLTGMRTYDPKSHTSDHLMASWIAREIARINGAPMFRAHDLMRR